MSNAPNGLPDLTRWNRAGLQQFRYVDGNAITYLETVRKTLAHVFPQWTDIQTDIPEDETGPETLARLQKLYSGPRRDWGWEIARSFVRANHILTEHINAFANEGYLNTATQWEYLRRLVDMIDYRPRPPGSASTVIALITKSDLSPNIVRKGLQTSYSPEDERPKLVFESLEDIEVDPALNAIRLKGWDSNPGDFRPDTPLEETPYWALPKKHDISTGQVGILLQGDEARAAEAARAVEISARDDFFLEIKDAEGDSTTIPQSALGQTKLLAEPDKVYACALNGPGVIRLSDTTDFATGQIIAWRQEGQIGFARIAASDRFSIKLADIRSPEMIIPTRPIEILKTIRISQDQFQAHDNEWRVSLDAGCLMLAIGSDQNGTLQDERGSMVMAKPAMADGSSQNTHKVLKDLSGNVLTDVIGHDLHLVQSPEAPVIAQSQTGPSRTELNFEGGAGQIVSGDYFVAESDGGTRTTIQVEKVLERANSFTLVVTNFTDQLTNVARLFGPFKHHLSPEGHDRNPELVSQTEMFLDLPLEQIPAGLVSGKTVIVEPEDPVDPMIAFTAQITDIILTGTHPRIVLKMPEGALTGYSIGALIIRGNSVKFGHGESKPFTILGSGDGSQTGQKFILEQEDISFVLDPRLESGVRADVHILVDERRYEEVSTLASSEPEDTHYSVRMTEEGLVEFTFGDGRNGRRLPTGRNNIVAIYRVGTGEDGNNVPPFGCETLEKPHKLVDTLRQPLPTSGGQNIESQDQIRTNAPASLKALDRGVSLADFEHIAMAMPGIWHAKAFSVPTVFSRNERIELTVVPVGNAPLGELKAGLETSLSESSPPHMVFSVSTFDPVPLVLELVLQIDSFAYDVDTVEEDVRIALFNRLSLQHRAPGEPLFGSQIYEVVEGVRGVSNSRSKLFRNTPDPILSENGNPLSRISKDEGDQIWALRPTDRQVIYLRSKTSIGITIEEASI